MMYWVNGVRADQNANRKTWEEEQMTPSGREIPSYVAMDQ